MTYPYNIINKKVANIFKNQISGSPLYIDLSIKNPTVKKLCEEETQKEFNDWIWKEVKKSGKTWSVSAYLENRTTLLHKYPQMVQENRVYHLGLDITVPLGFDLHAPLDGEVVVSEYEAGDGNYGAMVALKHEIDGETFYSLYGHLDKKHLPQLGSNIKQGEKFAKIGNFDTNGNWFYHTHLQVFTEKGYNEGWIHKGYCRNNELGTISEYCPDPTFLFRY